MAKTPDMDTEFAGWYAEVFMDQGPIRAARWKGVIDTAATADYETVEVLVRYAFATKAPADGGKNETLANKHKTVLANISGDRSPINPTSSYRELQVLSAAVLVRLFSSLPDAAIAVLTASFEGVRKTELPMDLPGLARRALIELSKCKHARPHTKEFEVAAPKVDFEVSQEAMANMSAVQWKNELDRLRDSVRASTRAIVDSQNRTAKTLIRQISLAEEELQMLWWLIGGHSSVANVAFTEVNTALRPLAFGHELGQLTEVSPGPASVAALLSRAGIVNEPLKVSDVINAADIDWIKDVTKSQRISPITTPLHFALEKRAELGSDDAWLPVWAAMTGLPAETSISAVRLAELFYREHLFLNIDE